jgi:hypothetical protein
MSRQAWPYTTEVNLKPTIASADKDAIRRQLAGAWDEALASRMTPLRLTNEKCRSVTIEPGRDDGVGTELVAASLVVTQPVGGFSIAYEMKGPMRSSRGRGVNWIAPTASHSGQGSSMKLTRDPACSSKSSSARRTYLSTA